MKGMWMDWKKTKKTLYGMNVMMAVMSDELILQDMVLTC